MKTIKQSILMLIAMTVIFGFIYPIAMTGIGHLAFMDKVKGSLITKDGVTAGSVLIGQNFKSAKYFHGRPSAGDYNALLSGGSNLGPTNQKLIDQATVHAAAFRKENNMKNNSVVPAEMALSSGSGLDPHISLVSAMLQVPRVASERKISEGDLFGLVSSLSKKQYGIAGYSFINVFKLNTALDDIEKK